MAKDGGELLLLPVREPASTVRFSHDGDSVYHTVISGPRENRGLWKISLNDGTASRPALLEGRRGSLGYYFASDAHYLLYFTWREDDGDIWVMDVVQGQ